MADCITFDRSVNNYTYESAYFDLINTKMKNEEALAEHLSLYIPINESKYKQIRAINEAKVSSKIKSKWDKFVAFIKNIFAKFLESIRNLLYSEKDYLEKYKDIILKKRPKDFEFSYVGNFEKGIQRCIDTELPIFNWQQHAAACKKEGYADVVHIIAKDLQYDEAADSLSENFKTYFFASENDKETTGKFVDLDFKAMYDFCYNYKKIEDIVKKDTSYLDKTTQAIQNAINTQIKQNQTTNVNPEQRQEDTPDEQSHSESYKLTSYSYYFNEANENDNNQQSNNKDNKPKEGTLAVKQMNSYGDRNTLTDEEIKQNGEGIADETQTEVDKVCNKWQDVCRAMLTAKCTVIQNIAKTYMTIIRTHVRSYVGNESDKTNNRSEVQSGKTYSKTNNKSKTQSGKNEEDREIYSNSKNKQLKPITDDTEV